MRAFSLCGTLAAARRRLALLTLWRAAGRSGEVGNPSPSPSPNPNTLTPNFAPDAVVRGAPRWHGPPLTLTLTLILILILIL
jgi:hypothetical protein